MDIEDRMLYKHLKSFDGVLSDEDQERLEYLEEMQKQSDSMPFGFISLRYPD